MSIHNIWARPWENVSYVNNKGADQLSRVIRKPVYAPCEQQRRRSIESHHQKTCLCPMRTTKAQINWIASSENLFMPYVNNKGADRLSRVIRKPVYALCEQQRRRSIESHHQKTCLCPMWTTKAQINWVSSSENLFMPYVNNKGADQLSRVIRKPVYALCEQQRCRSACASTQSDQRLCCSLLR